MRRRFQFSIGGFPPEAILTGFGILALVAAVVGKAGPLGGACLIEAAGAALGTALGIHAKRPWIASLLGVVAAFPLARMMYVLIGGSGC
jgi:hypothetical protein